MNLFILSCVFANGLFVCLLLCVFVVMAFVVATTVIVLLLEFLLEALLCSKSCINFPAYIFKEILMHQGIFIMDFYVVFYLLLVFKEKNIFWSWLNAKRMKELRMRLWVFRLFAFDLHLTQWIASCELCVGGLGERMWMRFTGYLDDDKLTSELVSSTNGNMISFVLDFIVHS